MFKRLIAGPLWFLATLSLYSVVAAALAAPREVGPVVALVVALLVVLDPAGLIWPAVPADRPGSATTPAVSIRQAPTTD